MMIDETQPSITTTQWAPLLDARRIKADKVAALLTRLATQSVQCLFSGGPRPVLRGSDLVLLQPLLGQVVWLGRERRAARRLLRPLRLAPPDPALVRSDIAILVASSVRRTGLLGRWRSGRNARRSALLGGAQLLGILEGAAWSRPELNDEALQAIRANWRQRTLFCPDEPAWPDIISTAALRILIAAAVRRPDDGLASRLTQGRLRRVLAGLDASLPDAMRTVAGGPHIEQLIVADALARLDRSLPPHIRRIAAILPVAQLPGFQRRFTDMGTGLADGDESGAKMAADQAVSEFAPFIVRLADGTL